ncbi:MAG: hypothetical protein LUC31_02005 [Coprobacillus sp.]|nr:hypothetical protein [Coprobacillus sp.]
MPSSPASKESKRRTLTCKVCFNKANEFTLYNIVSNFPLCDECLNKLKPTWHKEKINGYPALFIYEYDDAIRELIYKFKGCGDYELKDVFIRRYKWYLRSLYSGYLIVPAPSSDESNQERGFNHVEEIFKSCGFKLTKCVRKKYNFKQSSLSAKDRQGVKDKLEVVNGSQVTGKKILVVDDIYTTGSTIKAMINLLETYHPRKIKIFVISRTKSRENEL